jgi:hypothetical protein
VVRGRAWIRALKWTGIGRPTRDPALVGSPAHATSSGNRPSARSDGALMHYSAATLISKAVPEVVTMPTGLRSGTYLLQRHPARRRSEPEPRPVQPRSARHRLLPSRIVFSCCLFSSAQGERSHVLNVSKAPAARQLFSSEAFLMYKASFFVVLFLGIAHSAQAALPEAEGSSGWSVFSDPRYGTRVGYPSWFSVSAGRPQLGTGSAW